MTQSPSSLVVTESIVVEASVELTWTELVRACDADADQLTALLDEGVLVVEGVDPLTWRFADATLVEVEIVTGRTHQIRVHALHGGHPLAGDDKYGDEVFNKQLRTLGLKRLFLHAHSLSFPWGEGEIERRFSAPLAPELRKTLAALGSKR